MENYCKSKQNISNDKDIIKENINNISNFLNSTKEASQNYTLFNETLFINHNKWLDNIQSVIQKSIKNSEPNINISDINYDDSILSILKNIAKPNNYRDNNFKEKKSQCINNSEVFEKLDELTNFDDLKGAINTCSKYKRNSLLQKILDNKNNEINNNINNENFDNNVNSISIDDNFEIEYNDEDINEDNFTNKKTKIENDNLFAFNTNEKDENSLCTIIEQPSIEEKEKNSNISQSSNYFFNSKQYSFKNNINIQNNEKININNHMLESNNKNLNSNNIIKIDELSPDANNKSNNQLLNIVNITNSSIKSNNILNQNFNINSNNLISNSKSNSNSLETSPCFGQIKSNDYISKKNNTPLNNFIIPMPQLFSFSKSNNTLSGQKLGNQNGLAFSTQKKNEDNISGNKMFSSNKKTEVIVLHTSNIKEQQNNYLSDIKNNLNNNYSSNIKIKKYDSNNNKKDNNNFINILINNINNNISNQKNSENKENNYNNVIYNNINYTQNKNEFINNNYVQNIVLSSSCKKNVEKEEKYKDDFEQYEMSDSSFKEEEQEEEDEDKFIPKWALDKAYINERIIKQNKDKELIVKSFGNFVVENLNLNMIFETHNEEFDIRNSTADWRGDDSLVKNKVTNINDKEIDDIFPNRKLQF